MTLWLRSGLVLVGRGVVIAILPPMLKRALASKKNSRPTRDGRVSRGTTLSGSWHRRDSNAENKKPAPSRGGSIPAVPPSAAACATVKTAGFLLLCHFGQANRRKTDNIHSGTISDATTGLDLARLRSSCSRASSAPPWQSGSHHPRFADPPPGRVLLPFIALVMQLSGTVTRSTKSRQRFGRGFSRPTVPGRLCPFWSGR